jgi:surface antigen
VGSVAIMNVGAPYGHVGIVTAVKKDTRGQVTSITINEANYSACKLSTRSGLPSSLKVTGYFKP